MRKIDYLGFYAKRMKGEKTMKKMKLLSVGFVSALLFVGCNGQQASDSDSESPTSEDQIELVFWEFGNTGYDKLIAEYEEENPHVKINLQNSDMNDLHDNLFTSISAGSGAPDITMIEEAQIERYRNAEQAFHNLYELGAENVQDQYLDWVWRRGENADGTFMFGLPTDIGPTVMYYRTDVFEEAGFESSPEAVSELVATWDDFERVADEIYEKTGKQMADGAELIYNAKRDQAEQQYFNEDDQLIIEDHEHIRDAFDYTARLLDKGVIGDIPLWTPEWFAGMGDGSYATMLAPAWMQGVIKDNEPEEGVWSISTMPEGAGNWGGSYVAIPAESEHPEEAYKFVEWLTAPEQQLKSFLDYGLFPSAPAVYEMSEFMDYEDAYFGGLKTAQIFSEAAQAVEPVYKGRNYYPIDEEIKQAIDNVAAGSEPDDEWEAAIKRIQDVLNRQ